MKTTWLVILSVCTLLLSGCSWALEQEQKMVDWKVNLFKPELITPPPRLTQKLTSKGETPPPSPITPTTYPQPMTEAEVQQQYCDWARTQFGLPILFNKERKNAAGAKLGKEDAAQLFWPVAKANNTFRCLCGTPAEKKIAKCV